ncbi:uncharacterized protein LOC114946247 [Nylanderia fulva]|uniref:uncharacterized protein LOC114946247 n=1 Tax=Nylanderia fulva TaxID=613905 RepID=UPI0010FB049A|nr:uncharacterized protein LOC114946247 [Nylanderia fulva]
METTNLPTFDPNTETGNVYQRWTRWLRAFKLFLVSKRIEDDERKKAMLLHYAGFDVQDIFYAIPDAEVVVEGESQYTKAVQVLEEYFKPRMNTTYERHIFRNLSQGTGETMVQYVSRLRQQAKNCNFEDADTEICGQVIEKCHSTKLRRRLLEKCEVKLNEVLEIAKTMEAVSLQTKDIEGEAVARITDRKKQVKTGVTKTTNSVECYRCGYKGHKYTNEKCPAREKTCSKCGKQGHFARVCKTRMETTDNNYKKTDRKKGFDGSTRGQKKKKKEGSTRLA